jgi:hypothetical protein
MDFFSLPTIHNIRRVKSPPHVLLVDAYGEPLLIADEIAVNLTPKERKDTYSFRPEES